MKLYPNKIPFMRLPGISPVHVKFLDGFGKMRFLRILVPIIFISTVFLACGGSGGTVAGAPSDPIDPAPEGLSLLLLADGLSAPLFLAEAPDGSGRLFIVEQTGTVRVLLSDGSLLPAPFLDIRDRIIGFGERGFLGLAFHPEFASNGRFFTYYSAPLRSGAPAGFDHTSHISEFRVSAADPDLADPASERILLQVDQPQSNHNAGTVTFGPDGFLYISLGDGGGANGAGFGHVEDWYDANPGGNGQDVTNNLLGTILRIDVDAALPYGVPADNPFVGLPGVDEIFAYGFRNPYRISFDMGGTNQLFAADVGQARKEEVNIVTRGGNYGWNVKEGTECFNAADPNAPLDSCPGIDPVSGIPLTDPIIEFLNSGQEGGLGTAVIGGYVYRGSAVPELTGRYVFGSLTGPAGASGRIFVATPDARGLWPFTEPHIGSHPAGLGEALLGFGQDLSGEIYILTSGRVFRIVPPEE
jgi:glucose/arabinose dehydrogenase